MRDNDQRSMVSKPVQKRMVKNSWDAPEPRDSAKRIVKARVLLDINVSYSKDDHQHYQSGEDVMLTEEEAKEFCDREFIGFSAFRGSRETGQDPRYIHRRAERLNGKETGIAIDVR